MAESIDEYFTATISALTGPGSADTDVLRGLSPHRGAWTCSTHSWAAGISTWPRGGYGRAARASTRSARRATRATRRSPPRCGPPIPRCCTTARAASSSPARSRWTAATRCATSCSGWWPPPRSRSPAAGTRCSAATTSTSSRRRRRSPRTCRGRWAWRSRSVGHASSASNRRGPPMRSRCAASVTRRPTTRPRSAPSTPRCTPRIRVVPMPLLFVCEDNGIGISTRTPQGWIARTYDDREGLRVLQRRRHRSAVGSPPLRRPRIRRAQRRPAFLHLRTVRLMGHAGSDYEPAYRKPDEITADFDRDPVLCTARLLVDAGVLTPQQVLDPYESKRDEVLEMADRGRRTRPARRARRGDDATARRPRRRRRAVEAGGAPGPTPRVAQRSRSRRRSTARWRCWPPTRGTGVR